MNIYEYADVVKKDLVIRRFQGGRWIAYLDNCELKPRVGPSFGSGNGQREALENYVDKIKGKTLTSHPVHYIHPQIFEVPIDLTAE